MKTIDLKPYDFHVTDDIFSELFAKGLDREDGLKEIPADSLQLVVSALEYILWDLHTPTERNVMKCAISITERLRNEQQMREWNRKRKEDADHDS